jgi:phage terminase large subunit GpA-like protein
MVRIDGCVQTFRHAIRPPSKLSLSEWADQYAVLSAESSAEAGRWRTLPYQKGIMDAITNPAYERVSVKKSARVGYTKILNHALAYHIHQDPCSMMVVQPTIEDAEGYSKEEIAPMLRDTPVLIGVVSDAQTRDGSNSILHKLFPGGQLSLVGANSPRGFRRVSRRLVAFDETSAYPKSAGSEGSPIKLGIKRTDYFWNRKIIDGSTPGIEGECAISDSFEAGDQRRRFLPCPHCGHMQYLKFENLKWPSGDPMRAYMECQENACKIEHKSLRWMDERGEWRSTAVAKNPKHVSFHVWAAYSYSPNSTWGHIAAEWIDCAKDSNLQKTFLNTVLGETWSERGDLPEFMRLYERREAYELNTLPPEVMFLTAGADVQKNRIEVEIVGWGRDKQSWSIDYRVFPGDTATDVPWLELDKLLDETWVSPDGRELKLRMLCVDSGFASQHVYNWAKNKPPERVRAVKGRDNQDTIFSTPKDTEVSSNGKRLARAVRVWSVGVSVIKGELYSWLQMDGAGDDGKYRPGFCHYPQYDLDFFKALCSEQRIEKVEKGRTVFRWEKIRERNEQLDTRVYARAAAAMVGMDRFKAVDWDFLAGKYDYPKTPNVEPVPVSLAKPVMTNNEPTRPSFMGRQKKSFW